MNWKNLPKLIYFWRISISGPNKLAKCGKLSPPSTSSRSFCLRTSSFSIFTCSISCHPMKMLVIGSVNVLRNSPGPHCTRKSPCQISHLKIESSSCHPIPNTQKQHLPNPLQRVKDMFKHGWIILGHRLDFRFGFWHLRSYFINTPQQSPETRPLGSVLMRISKNPKQKLLYSWVEGGTGMFLETTNGCWAFSFVN